MSKILILGANGQVGSALKQLLGEQGIALDRSSANLAQPESLAATLNEYQPTAIINAAAYTQVDKAEEEKELALTINAKSPAILAQYCLERDIPLIHYSTDYVFNGEGERAWQEEDVTSPLNAYGETKLRGEQAIENTGGKYLIFRTSWVYDASGKNFLNTMLRHGAVKEELSVVNDQFGAPTYARHLAEATLKALKAANAKDAFPSGIYHLCNRGTTTWYDFANRIFDQAEACNIRLAVKKVNAIPSSAYPTPAKRPHNSRLDCTKAKTILNIRLPSWEDGVAECMKEKASNESHRRSA